VPSASPHSARLAVFAVCSLLLAGAFAGCSTTQEKAEMQQARAKRILETRDERRKKKREEAHQDRSEKR
jgi:hypothetical protein